MQSLLSPHVVYAPDDVDAALARVFGPGVRPLRVEDALFEAMLAGWRSQQAARLLKAKTVRANEATVRALAEATGAWPWQWRASDADEFFEDLLARPQRRARTTLRAKARKFAHAKVNRCITEGRRRFMERYAELEAGAECERLGGRRW
jgi:surface antigen